MHTKRDFWGQDHKAEWVIFHDESFCRDEQFLYHGFTFISRREGRSILDRLFQPYTEVQRCEKEIHFSDLRGAGTERSMIARHWVNLCKEEWLCSDSMKLYILGVNLANINHNLYSQYSDDKVYVRFYEIGLKSSLAWFGLKSEQISHLFYDEGKLDVKRYNKSMQLFSKNTRIQPLLSDYQTSRNEMSKFLQLTDVMLGTVRKSFTEVGKAAGGQKRCVDIFQDVTLRFTNSSSAYNRKSKYWKKLGLSFFPARKDITPEEFMAKDLDYHKKVKDLFYCDRETHTERQSKANQMSLGF